MKSHRRSYSKKKYPRGSISRKKKSPIGKKIKARSRCVKSRSLRSRRVLPPLKKGSLTRFGYTVHESVEKRRSALRRALKAYGYSSLIKKLNAVKILTKNTSPTNSKIYGSDIKYLQNLNPKKSGRKSKRS